jgi:hypothetical protein
LVTADLLGAQHGEPLAEIAGEPRNLLDVGALGMRREIAHLHVFDHAADEGVVGKLHCRGPSDATASRQESARIRLSAGFDERAAAPAKGNSLRWVEFSSVL